MCTSTCKIDASPSSTSLENIPKPTLLHPGWHQRRSENQTKVLMVRSWTSVWDVIRSTPGASSRHLGGRTRRDEKGTSVGDGQTKFNQGRKASVKRLPTPPSRAGRDASSGKKPRLWRPLFSLLRMGSSSSRTTPLKCIFSKMLGQV